MRLVVKKSFGMLGPGGQECGGPAVASLPGLVLLGPPAHLGPSQVPKSVRGFFKLFKFF